MMFTYNNFGQIQIGRELYQHDVVLNNKTVERRQKKKSKPLRAQFGHTPLGPKENIPWDCTELVIGTGYYGRLPITEAVIHEAEPQRRDRLPLGSQRAKRETTARSRRLGPL